MTRRESPVSSTFSGHNDSPGLFAEQDLQGTVASEAADRHDPPGPGRVAPAWSEGRDYGLKTSFASDVTPRAGSPPTV